MEKISRKRNLLFIAAIILVSLNLRAPIIGVGSLVSIIQKDLSLSGGIAGFLTTIPLLVFAVVSPLAGSIARRFGIGRVLFISMLVVAVGIVLRSWCGSFGLFFGTVLLGIGIGVSNVLIPGVIKERFPDRIGAVTGIYASAMSLACAGAAAAAVPLAAAGLGWRGSLGVLAFLAVGAACVWMPLRGFTARHDAAHRHGTVWKSKTAWFCTLYMGTQAILFYSISAWLPSILAERGIDSVAAGTMASVYQLVAVPVNLAIPLVTGRFRDLRKLTFLIALTYFCGVLCLWLGRSAGILWLATVICGCATAATFSLCMTLIGLRTHNSDDAAELSGMLQSLGYLIAAIGPVLYGKLFDLSGSWSVPTFVMVLGMLLNAVAGNLAGRSGFVE